MGINNGIIVQAAKRMGNTFFVKKIFPIGLNFLINISSSLLVLFYNQIQAYVFWIVAAIILAAIAVAIWQLRNAIAEDKRRKAVSSVLEQEDMKKKCRGLVIYASIVKDNDKDSINSAIEKYSEIEKLSENDKRATIDGLLGLPGIGTAIRAILHHSGDLEHLWILYSQGVSGSEWCKDRVVEFVVNVKKSVTVTGVPVSDPNSASKIGAVIQLEIKDKLPGLGLKACEVAFNLTGGNAISSCAMALKNIPLLGDACVLEYVIQQNPKKLVEISLKEK